MKNNITINRSDGKDPIVHESVFGYQLTADVLVILLDENNVVIYPIRNVENIFVENIKEESLQLELDLPDNVVPIG